MIRKEDTTMQEAFRDSEMVKTDRMEEIIVECLGYKAAFEAVSKALSYSVKADIYEYIIRVYDL